MQNKPGKVDKVIRHRRLLVFILFAALTFLLAHQVWFYVMGTLAVIGAVWVIREYNKENE